MIKLALSTFCLAATFAATLPAQTSDTWSAKTAAAYLDGRSNWWMTWPQSARDHGTFCVSCHTAVPYALSRLTLRSALAEEGPSATETKLLENVAKRVNLWSEVEPFYKDGKSGPTKSSESRGTESVLNTLILATYDSPTGKLSDNTKTAFANMWALQVTEGDKRGAWTWLDFHNRPWEADDSQYYGSTLAAIAIGCAPASYRASAEVQPKIAMLVSYLKEGYEAQSPVNKLAVLWASAKLPGILTARQRQSLIDDTIHAQQEDGGWSLTSLAGTWKRRDSTPLEAKSDGYATGMVAYVLQRAGIARDQKPVKQGLDWLSKNQSKSDGLWLAYSLNKNRDLTSDVGRFMSDAATAYAVMALTTSTNPVPPPTLP